MKLNKHTYRSVWKKKKKKRTAHWNIYIWFYCVNKRKNQNENTATKKQKEKVLFIVQKSKEKRFGTQTDLHCGSKKLSKLIAVWTLFPHPHRQKKNAFLERS